MIDGVQLTQLDQVRVPSVMALCLHELDSRDLLETGLHMLPFAFTDDSPGRHLQFL
jgi:hypothetical protein